MRQRARKEEDKTARRRAILDAARAIWARSSYGELTMSAVAARAGVVKGTLYLYFPSKEELFLELFEELVGGWLAELDRELSRGAGRWDVGRVAALVGRSLRAREALTRLIPLVGGVLEHNVSDARARRFKQDLLARVTRTAALLSARLPRLGAAGAARFLFQVYAVTSGFAEMAHPAPVVRRVVAEPGLEPFRIDLAAEVEAAALALLRGAGPATRRGPARRR